MQGQKSAAQGSQFDDTAHTHSILSRSPVSAGTPAPSLHARTRSQRAHHQKAFFCASKPATPAHCHRHHPFSHLFEIACKQHFEQLRATQPGSPLRAMHTADPLLLATSTRMRCTRGKARRGRARVAALCMQSCMLPARKEEHAARNPCIACARALGQSLLRLRHDTTLCRQVNFWGKSRCMHARVCAHGSCAQECMRVPGLRAGAALLSTAPVVCCCVGSICQHTAARVCVSRDASPADSCARHCAPRRGGAPALHVGVRTRARYALVCGSLASVAAGRFY